MGVGDEAILEPFCQGKEFTVIVLQNAADEPVALVPTEIEISYAGGQIFDYRRKYLPTNNTQWHCPPRFEGQVIETIQTQAQAIFALFGMRDFARLDGWLLDDGRVLFTDFNPISGMEQNSFLFQQCSRLGLTHHAILSFILGHACARAGVTVPSIEAPVVGNQSLVHVLFGGNTAERQVSLMSGTNVWLKLRASQRYQAEPYFLDFNGDVWHLPYTYALNHTVEEVLENCLAARSVTEQLAALRSPVLARLGLSAEEGLPLPEKMTFEAFVALSQQQKAFVFLGLHGGQGEDGRIQQQLTKAGLLYNGSGEVASALCMDKYQTALAVAGMQNPEIQAAPKRPFTLSELQAFTEEECQVLWQALCDEWVCNALIVKPQHEGCSAGIVRLTSANALVRYIVLMSEEATQIAAGTFADQGGIVELSTASNGEYLLEPFIETDKLRIEGNAIVHQPTTGWVELTVGVLEEQGQYYALTPSITIAESHVLSLAEKFQGGTGINLTPPPEEIMPISMRYKVQAGVVQVAEVLGIENYARMDVFFNLNTQELLVIEANSLPGLTPSTVIYHQALVETPPVYPTRFLEQLVELKSGQVVNVVAD